jgi:hypothetical protein
MRLQRDAAKRRAPEACRSRIGERTRDKFISTGHRIMISGNTNNHRSGFYEMTLIRVFSGPVADQAGSAIFMDEGYWFSRVDFGFAKTSQIGN